MFAGLARARFLAFFFVTGLALKAICDLCAVVETPRDALLGEALHLVGLGLVVTTMLDDFNATLRHPRVTSLACGAYIAWHAVSLLRMTFA